MNSGSYYRLTLILASVAVLQACGGGNSAGVVSAVTPAANNDVATPDGGGASFGAGDAIPSPGDIAVAAAVQTEPLATATPLPWIKPISLSVANFNLAPDRVSSWTYINGNEFPGAKGGLTEVSSELDGTPAARLSYDLGCSATAIGLKTAAACGRYVGMSYRLPVPIDVVVADAPVLAFSFKNPQSVVNPFIRIIDGSGQTLQFKAYGRSVEVPGGDRWQRIYVPISKSATYYGGANDGVLHSPVKGIFIGVGDFSLQTPAGWIDIDDIEILKTPAYGYELKPATVQSAVSQFPSYVGRLAATTYTSMSVAHDKAKAVGINIVRRDLLWSSVEKNGVYDFTEANGIVSALADKGMSILWILRGGHPDHGGGTPATDADRDAYAKFAAATALNFKGKNVVGFEIWNEPNGAQFWPNKDPLDYARLLNRAGAAIRAVNPSVKVVSGGTAGVDMTYTIQMAAATSSTAVDAVAVHPYALKSNPENYSYGMAPLNNVVVTQGLNKPLWVTEWGYSSFGDFDSAVYGDGYSAAARNRQAVLVLRTVLTQLALDVPFITLHSLVDYGADPSHRETNFGLLTNNGSDKPAIFAMRMLYSAQAGRSFKGTFNDVPPGLHVVKWESGVDRVFAIWADNASAGAYSLRIPAAANFLKKWDGTNLLGASNGAYRDLTVAEKDGPIFVRIPK